MDSKLWEQVEFARARFREAEESLGKVACRLDRDRDALERRAAKLAVAAGPLSNQDAILLAWALCVSLAERVPEALPQ